MRIGIDYTAAVRQSAGIGRYTRELIRALSRIDLENDYVLFSAGRDQNEALWPDNYRRRSLPLTDRHLAILWHRLRLPLPVELITGSIDIYHSPDFVLPPVARARTALTVHDLSFMRYPECSSPPLLDYLMRHVPRSVARADLILADSQSTLRDLVDLLHVTEECVQVVYPAIGDRFQPVPLTKAQSVHERYGIRRPYILSLGTLQPRKNYPRLIQAFARLRAERGIPHQLVIGGGRGWLGEAIEETITSLGLEDHVHLAGFIDDGDLPALYSAADLFSFPSLYEGFGIPVLEAMACGTPVVTSNVSSLPEAAGDAALLVDPLDVGDIAQAIWRALDDSDLRYRLIERGLVQSTVFTWDRSARELLDAYRGLID